MVVMKKSDNTFSRFDTDHKCDGRRDWQTNNDCHRAVRRAVKTEIVGPNHDNVLPNPSPTARGLLFQRDVWLPR